MEKNIANLLPKGLTEEALNEIALLVENTIKEEVDKKVKLVSTKVSAYLKSKMDAIKETALQELASENEVYRNAQLFEEVRNLMTLEIKSKDEDSSVHDIVTANKELEEEISVLGKEFNSLLQDNSLLERTQKDLTAKLAKNMKLVESLKEQKLQAIREAKENTPKPFKSSEKAKMITNNVDSGPEVTPNIDNEYLTEEVIELSK